MSRRPLISAALAVAAVVAIVGVIAVLSHRGGNQSDTAAQQGSASPSAGASQSPSHLVPATSKRPAAGVCGRTTGAVLTVRIEPDTPDPRCASVNADQRLRVVNATGDYGAHPQTVTVVWMPGQSLTLRPGEAKTFSRNFGSYLAPGVHELTAGRGYRSEVWLR
jgi:hypothetical protein